MSRSDGIASGGAATAISPEGDVKLVLKLDKSWIVRFEFSLHELFN
jgi:hypothetical protein